MRPDPERTYRHSEDCSSWPRYGGHSCDCPVEDVQLLREALELVRRDCDEYPGRPLDPSTVKRVLHVLELTQSAPTRKEG